MIANNVRANPPRELFAPPRADKKHFPVQLEILVDKTIHPLPVQVNKKYIAFCEINFISGQMLRIFGQNAR